MCGWLKTDNHLMASFLERHQKGQLFGILMKHKIMIRHWHQANYIKTICSSLQTVSNVDTSSFDEHSRSRHHKHGTLSLLTLDPALPYRHLNAISKPTFSLILNWHHKRLCIPHRTPWRYTNVVLLLLLLLLLFVSGRMAVMQPYSSVTVGPALHWPCVTDLNGLSTRRLNTEVREMRTHQNNMKNDTIFSRASHTLRDATQVVTFLSVRDKKCREGPKR